MLSKYLARGTMDSPAPSLLGTALAIGVSWYIFHAVQMDGLQWLEEVGFLSALAWMVSANATGHIAALANRAAATLAVAATLPPALSWLL